MDMSNRIQIRAEGGSFQLRRRKRRSVKKKTPSYGHRTTPRFLVLLALLLPLHSGSTIATIHDESLQRISVEESRKDSWYKRYPIYPPYCSTPEEMAKRHVPPMDNFATKDDPPDAENNSTTPTTHSPTGQSQLVHVTALIRHGARTPWSGDLQCWEGYAHPTADTHHWDCDLTTLLSPPSPNRVEEEEQDDDKNRTTDAMLLFEKRYTALVNTEMDLAQYNLSNSLRGTCQLGQLILQGYEQELTNGQILRKAYLDTAKDGRMQLMDSSVLAASLGNGPKTSYPWDEGNLYYRADDGQRTLMSGQVLLRGLFGPEVEHYYNTKDNGYPVIPLHTADYVRDVLDPNEFRCPRLKQMHDEFMQSPTYQEFLNSKESVLLRQFRQKVLKVPEEQLDNYEAVDCLMTTMCTDRTLPDVLNDYKGEVPVTTDDSSNPYGENRFKRLFQNQVDRFALLYRDNDAAFAKLAMAPLWMEILTTINGILQEEPEVCCPKRPPSKLALFSGHDTTLMPILATLGPRVFDGIWAPYASMILIEIHKINLDGGKDSQVYESDYAFRLVYNGKILTHLVDGCPEEAQLCDAQVLVDHVASFATPTEQNFGCAIRDPFSVTTTGSDQFSSSTLGKILSMLLLSVGSALFGGLATYLCLNRRPVRRRRQHKEGLTPVSQHDDEEEDGRGFSMTLRTDRRSSTTDQIAPESEGTFIT